jgi:tetratricopeptide (TPR) repeat protein
MGFVGKWYGFGQNVDYDAGVRAKTKGDWPAAIICFRKAFQEHHDSAFKSVIRRSLAGALGSLAKQDLAQDPEAALDLLKEALDLEPTFADLWLATARASRALSQKKAEVDAIASALQINPKYAEALIHQAALLFETNDRQEARLRLQRAAQASPRLAESIRLAGEDGEQLLRLRLPYYDQAAQLIRRGEELGKAALWMEASLAYAEVLALAPGYADVRCRRAEALMAIDEFDQAEFELHRALETNPRYAEALAIMGVLKKRQGLTSEALSYLKKALEADPSQPIAREEILRS